MATVATDPEITSLPVLDMAPLIVCVGCDATVFEWSTPHVDRCWECAEIVDLEAGR